MRNDMYNFPRSSNGLPLVARSAPCSPVKSANPRRSYSSSQCSNHDSFHVVHKIPLGDSPYVRAKHVQLVDKDPDRAIALFWSAINAGDRVDSALKDMAIVMKQQNRPEEAIEAIKSLRFRCSDQAQESLDNVLLDLYKRCGRLDEQIALLKHKLDMIHQGVAFNGKRTKTARSQGKKFQVSIEQEATRLLGNLGWAYMQQSNFPAAEAVYRKALSIEPDNNKVCNLGICLMKQGRVEEAKKILQSVTPTGDSRWGSESHIKSYERAQEMLKEMDASDENRKATVADAEGSAVASAVSVTETTPTAAALPTVGVANAAIDNSKKHAASEYAFNIPLAVSDGNRSLQGSKEAEKAQSNKRNSYQYTHNHHHSISLINPFDSMHLNENSSVSQGFLHQQDHNVPSAVTPQQLYFSPFSTPPIMGQNIPLQGNAVPPKPPLPFPHRAFPDRYSANGYMSLWDNGSWTPPSEDFSPSPEEESHHWFNVRSSVYHSPLKSVHQTQDGMKWHAEMLRQRLEAVSLSQSAQWGGPAPIPPVSQPNSNLLKNPNDQCGASERIPLVDKLSSSNLRADAPIFPVVGPAKPKAFSKAPVGHERSKSALQSLPIEKVVTVGGHSDSNLVESARFYPLGCTEAVPENTAIAYSFSSPNGNAENCDPTAEPWDYEKCDFVMPRPQEKNSHVSTPPGLWASLGFTESPKRIDFAEKVSERPEFVGWANSTQVGSPLGDKQSQQVTQEINRQRRLRIFQDLSVRAEVC